MASIAVSWAPTTMCLETRDVLRLDIEILSTLSVVDFSMNSVLSANGKRHSGELGKNQAGLVYRVPAPREYHYRKSQTKQKIQSRKERIMRSIIVTKTGGPDVLRLSDAPIPDIDDDLVLVRVKAAGINYADIMQRMGLYPNGPQPPFPQVSRLPASSRKSVRTSTTGRRAMR